MAKRIGIIALLLCLCLGYFPCSAASGGINPEKDCVLALSYQCEGVALANAPLKIYKIADVSSDGEYTLVPSLQQTGLVLNGIQTAAEWDAIRSTLEGYLIATAAKSNIQAVTDQEGKVTLQGLKAGLYMVDAVEQVQGEQHYFFASALIALPAIVDGRWQYQASVHPKGEVLPPIGPNEEIEWKVLKLWKGDAAEQRPQAIEVEIFRNGDRYKKVTLSQENQWCYQWSAPADGASWKVIERNVPAGYRMMVEERGATFLITNTYENPNPPAPPHTGNSFSMPFYLLLMSVSGMMLLLLGLVGKRRRAE